MGGSKVVVIGQGYVGLPVAVRAAQVGHTVTGFDVSQERVDSLNAGISYVADISDQQLAEATQRGYRATTDSAELAGFDIAIVSVPTPLTDGAPDLSFIEAAAKDL
ncbi:MAG TPA: 3-hydroxyacyl-CoA dehydrogenase NAD-binding domain-containing protein, partial [Ilumatobacteraceae bacterium]|nr:3-hydroxyacyl-CoA dehydrogenase NAD-binding domain-containing protein [Ilumatobacteraceae bacterium]